MQRKNNLLRLTESAIMIALATVLSEIKLMNLPMGGSVTAFSMVPILIIAYRYGTRWGLFTGTVYGVFQMLLGMENLRYGTSLGAFLVILLFDYLIAFGVLGLGGLFRGKMHQNQPLELALGALLCSALRYVCHFISGWTVWGIWAPEGMPAWQYSLGYNATYMVPETIISVVGVFLLALYLDFTSKNITRRAKKEEDALYERNPIASATKLTGIGVICTGLLSAIFDAINVLLTEDLELNKEALLLKVIGTVILGVVLFALGEVVQLLNDLRGRKRNSSNDSQN